MRGQLCEFSFSQTFKTHVKHPESHETSSRWVKNDHHSNHHTLPITWVRRKHFQSHVALLGLET